MSTETAVTPATSPVEEEGPSSTIVEFCRLEALSLASYHKLRRAGLGPEVSVPSGPIVRITAKSRREWHARMAELSRQEAAKLEQRRRVEQARRAGKVAAASPDHVSRKPRRKRQHRP